MPPLHQPPPNLPRIGSLRVASNSGEGLNEAQGRLAALEAELAPLQAEMDQLSRQFWVGKAQVKANKYDLSASRYRPVQADEAYHEKPAVILERLAKLEQVMGEEISIIFKLLE